MDDRKIVCNGIHTEFDEAHAQAYIVMPDGLRLIFNDLGEGNFKYIGYSTAGVDET